MTPEELRGCLRSAQLCETCWDLLIQLSSPTVSALEPHADRCSFCGAALRHEIDLVELEDVLLLYRAHCACGWQATSASAEVRGWNVALHLEAPVPIDSGVAQPDLHSAA